MPTEIASENMKLTIVKIFNQVSLLLFFPSRVTL